MSTEEIRDYYSSDKGVDQDTSSSQWLMSFSDLLSLILTFFVLIYSMSSVQDVEWEKVTRTLGQKLKPGAEIDYTTPSAELGIEKKERKKMANLEYLNAVIRDKMRANSAFSNIAKLRYDSYFLTLSLEADAIFKDGTTDLTKQGAAILLQVGEMLQSISNQLYVVGSVVRGKVDKDGPEEKKATETNWPISLKQSLIAAQLLSTSGYSYNIAGYGRTGQNNNMISKERPLFSVAPEEIGIMISSFKAE